MHIRSADASAVWGALCDSMPAACGPDYSGPPEPSDASDIIAVLDDAGVEKGAILSLGYFYGFPELAGSDYDKPDFVRAENAFVAEQVALYPDRLCGFFSVNPLAPYALDEVRYWAAQDDHCGLKLHFANSNFSFQDPEQVAQIKQILSVLSEHDLALVIHMRNRNPEYGAADAQVLIDALAEAAPDITVQIAHMAGWGSYDAGTDAALGTFVGAFEAGSLKRENLYFDLAAVVMADQPPEALKPLPGRLRQIGLSHILFATDWDALESPREYIQTLQTQLGLTAEEWEMVRENQAPYFEDGK